MLLWRQLAAGERIALTDGRQHRLALGQLGIGIVGPFDVRPQITGELDCLAAGLKDGAAAFDPDRHAASAGVGHLAGDRPLPDQVVKLELVGAQFSAQLLRENRMGGRPAESLRGPLERS